jgi:cytochrome c-type biogenesis protein CcmH/NrfF
MNEIAWILPMVAGWIVAGLWWITANRWKKVALEWERLANEMADNYKRLARRR